MTEARLPTRLTLSQGRAPDVSRRRFQTIRDIPREELLAPGHKMCQGCGAALAFRYLLKAVGKDAIIVQATGCVEVTTTPYPETAWRVPYIHVAFENAASVASGIAAAIRVLQRKGVIPRDKRIKVVATAGDGGTFDIGFQALSGMLERGDNVMFVVYDNEAYMNTGIQRSGATPYGAWTTTTPVGRRWRGEWRWKKDIIGVALAHRIPYIATTTVAYPLDMLEKFRRAFETEGPALVHVLTPCPPGWRFPPEKTIEMSRLATLTGMWINLEIVEGVPRVTVKVPKRKPVRVYLRAQGRFRHLTDEDIKFIQRIVDEEVKRINEWVGEEAIGPVEEEG